jgi:hypothetical protein
MEKRKSQKKCGDCVNWRVKDSPCTYYDDIVKRIIMNTDPACDDFCPKGKDKPRTHKSSGYSEQGNYEAIYYNGKPTFLTLSKDTFRVYDEVTAETETFLPKEYPNEFPYEPYGFFEGSIPNRDALFWKVRDEFDLFLDVESIWKDYLAACVLLSYQQEKIRTVPYPYFVGDNESGKTVALNLLNWLCYRPMMGVTIPSADIYGYLDDSDAPGTILEDEVQGMHKDMDKAKIYKAGYKRGAVVPRTIITQNKRQIKYYRVFCFKSCAAEEMPRVKGLLERFTFIPMTEGNPKKDWADLNKEDENRFRELRNILLKWRLASCDWELPEIELPVKGRLKELWKPIIQVIAGLTIEKDLRAHLELVYKERLHEKVNTLEGHIVKVVCELFVSGEPLSFTDIWDGLVKDLEGKIDEKKLNKMDTPEFSEVTKQKIGYRLREVLGGKKTKARGETGQSRAYDFDAEKLKRIAKKYNCVTKNKLTSGTSSEERAQLNHEKQLAEASVFSENKPVVEIEKPKDPVDIPAKVVQLGNSFSTVNFEELAAKTKSVYRLKMDFGIEGCVVCGAKGRPDWQVTQFDDSWGFLCGSCGEKLSSKIGKSEAG